MARKLRIEFPGALYHVIVRGNNRESIFAAENEKSEYLEIIRRYKERYFFKLYAFVIMDNHGHLLIEVDKVPLSKIMQGIQQVYTSFYNREHGRVGHVFQQRYKALLCDKDNYLLAVIRYIHHNPLEAGIINDLNYKWSSHVHYINPKKTNIVDIEYPLSLFSSNPNQALLKYHKFMNETDEGLLFSDFELPFSFSHKSGPLKMKNNQPGVSLDDLLQCLSEDFGLTKNAIFSSRARKIVKVRKLFTYIAARNCSVAQNEIANFLGVSQALVAKYLATFEETNEFRQIESGIINKLIK